MLGEVNRYKKIMYAKLIVLFCLSACSYFVISYQTHRSSFLILIGLYTFLFAQYLYFVKIRNNQDLFKILLLGGIAFRFLLLFSFPNLSNDYFRFIWDGHLLDNGINPYQYLPKDIINLKNIQAIGGMTDLYNGMGSLSQNNYSCYPPFNQFFFWLAATISPGNIMGSVIVMKFAIFLAEVGTIFFSRKILIKLKITESNILLYSLNPLVIIELTGNLHFEGIMIFLLILAMYLLLLGRKYLSSIILSLSILVKLVPLIFLPLFYRKLGIKDSVRYYILTGVFFLGAFSFFVDIELIRNFLASINLYFQRFEFNASIYYLVREVGYWIYDYNIIWIAGVVLSIVSFFIILLIAVRMKTDKNKVLFSAMLLSLSTYYFLTTTVHSWYLTMLIALSVFTSFRYVIVWSFVIFLSYYAYRTELYQENLWLILVEYVIVYGYLIHEIFMFFKYKQV